MPLWAPLLARLRLPRTAARAWPWAVLLSAGLLLWFGLRHSPIATWSATEYQSSPIVWTQFAEAGTVAQQVQPASFGPGQSPLLIWGALLLGSVLLGLGLAGLAQLRRGEAVAAPAAWRQPVLLAAGLILAALLAAAFNTALSTALFNLDSTVRFLLAAVVATLVGIGLGSLMEITLIRPLYARAIYQIMLTFGLAFIGTEMVRAVWGRTGFTMPKPSLFAGTDEGCPAASLSDWLRYHCSTLAVEIGGQRALIRTYNEIFVILVGLIVLVAVWLLLQRSRLGMIIRAGVQDSAMVEALGINVRRVFTLVFGLGVGLAALGGVIAAPAGGLSDAMGATLLLGSLIALAIGGLTSYPGAAAGAIIVGLVQQFIIRYGQIGIKLPFLAEPWKPTPPIVPASTILLMIIILLVLPQGLFGRKE
ncbi:MAG: branched-chain amino acid ABC transporter permease [Caldilineales bacterium]